MYIGTILLYILDVKLFYNHVRIGFCRYTSIEIDYNL